jgi:hypothetical protein
MCSASEMLAWTALRITFSASVRRTRGLPRGPQRPTVFRRGEVCISCSSAWSRPGTASTPPREAALEPPGLPAGRCRRRLPAGRTRSRPRSRRGTPPAADQAGGGPPTGGASLSLLRCINGLAGSRSCRPSRARAEPTGWHSGSSLSMCPRTFPLERALEYGRSPSSAATRIEPDAGERFVAEALAGRGPVGGRMRSSDAPAANTCLWGDRTSGVGRST